MDKNLRILWDWVPRLWRRRRRRKLARTSIRSLLERHGLGSLRLNAKFASANIIMKQPDRDAAWELYVEMLTRIITQPLPLEHGDEETALNSVYNLFPVTREILKRQGRHCIQFTKIAVPVLNQIVRPFTAKWHRRKLEGAFAEKEQCNAFRQELKALQQDLKKYANLLADIAEVECLTEIETK